MDRRTMNVANVMTLKVTRNLRQPRLEQLYISFGCFFGVVTVQPVEDPIPFVIFYGIESGRFNNNGGIQLKICNITVDFQTR